MDPYYVVSAKDCCWLPHLEAGFILSGPEPRMGTKVCWDPESDRNYFLKVSPHLKKETSMLTTNSITKQVRILGQDRTGEGQVLQELIGEVLRGEDIQTGLEG